MAKLSDLGDKKLLKETNKKTAQRLAKLITTNPKYRNLSKSDREVVMDILDKYERRIEEGYSITSSMIKNDRYKLYQKRLDLGLSSTDLKQIYKLMESFK
jgi:Txe/YoeB family toxin of Txe-Axe toxin-antitoxin module